MYGKKQKRRPRRKRTEALRIETVFLPVRQIYQKNVAFRRVNSRCSVD